MWPRLFLIVICLLQTCIGITVTEKAEKSTDHSTAEEQSKTTFKESSIKYRVSEPKLKYSQNRVPAHLQGINRGYVYDDADDVIHIIEPPQHFRELKRLLNEKSESAAVWEQRSKVHISRPQASASSATISVAVDRNRPAQPTKVKESSSTPLQLETAKVKMQLRLRNAKPVAADRNKRRGIDLQTQESKVPPSYYLQHFSAPKQAAAALQQQIPMEILASVRKTERLMHTKRAALLPLARQRHKSKKTHTVIAEKGYEHEKYQHGQDMRLYGELQSQHRKNINLRKSSRVKREIRQTTRATHAQQVNQHVYTETQKGHKLLMHITELLKNASYYLPDEPLTAVNVSAATTTNVESTPNSTSLLHELCENFQYNSLPKSLIGEIEPTQAATVKQPEGVQILEENVLIKILENSLNATDAIMSEIMRKNNSTGNSTESTKICGSSGDNGHSSTRSRFKTLQNRINCMREQVHSKTGVTLKTTEKRFGDRTREKLTTATLFHSTLAPDLRFKKLKNFARGNKTKLGVNNKNTTTTTIKQPQTTRNATDNTTPLPSQFSAADERNISAVLLYDDIMTNIRNMLQARNLKMLEEQQTASDEAAAPVNIPFLNAEPPAEAAEKDEADFGNLRDLNKYLNELQQIVANLPTIPTTPTTSTTTQLTLNSHELSGSYSDSDSDSDSGANLITYPPRADWYLINGSGKIFQTHLNDELKPTVSIFHRFPDIPNATNYLRNLAAQSKSFEIL